MLRRNNDLLFENRFTATDIFQIEDLFEQIKIGEARLDNLFNQDKNGDPDKIRQELISMRNYHELLQEKTEGRNQYIEDNYRSRLKITGERINKLLERAEKTGITIGINCL